MPDFKDEIRQRLSALNLPSGREAEIIDEMAQHLGDRYEQALHGGATDEEAHQAALLELDEGNTLMRGLQTVERPVPKDSTVPGAPRAHLLGDLGRDLRYGARMLTKNPGFTMIAMLALALGIGANSAIFSVVNTVLLLPLPYKNPERLVMLWEDATHQGFPRNTPSPANYLDWRGQSQVFERMAATATLSINLTGTNQPEQVDGRRVTSDLFALLGVTPQLGRAFLSQEDQPGNNHVVMLSHSLWQRRFAADPGLVGRPISLDGESYTVVGIMSSSFQFPSRGDQLWIPMAFTPKEANSRGDHYLEVVARIKSGITLSQAQVEMDTIAARLQRQYPEDNARIGVVVTPLHEQVVGDIKPALLVLLGSVSFVLLIACANVANLLLARAAARQKEIALRLAFGASRSRLIRQFLTESFLLAALGGGAGLLLSVVGIDVLKSFIPDNISQAQSVSIDAKVMGFTLLISLFTGVIFGLAPALQASKFDLNDTLKEGGKGSGGGSRGNRLRSILVIGEVAVSLVLLIGAGLLINSFLRLRHLDPGFRVDHLLTMKVALPELKYSDPVRRAAFYRELTRRAAAVPGVQSAAVASNLPLTYNGDSISIGIEGRPEPPPDQRPDVVTRVVGPGYLATMGITLSQGRQITERDRSDSPGVVIISERMARLLWLGENPLGKRLKPGSSASARPWLEIVGVAKDVRQNDLEAAPKLQMYLPYEQTRFFAPNALVVRTTVEPMSLAGTMEKIVWDLDKDQPVSNVRTMEEIVSESVARQRFSMLLLGVFAALAIVLAAVGIYGVMSYSVAQRTHEIGIRLALGAQKRDVLRLVVWQGARLALVGVVIGLGAATALTRMMSSLLFGVSSTDPGTFTLVSVGLVGVALFASYVPALRATRVDPMIALRHQ